MEGFKEGVGAGVRAIVANRHLYERKSLSPNTQRTLQVTMESIFPRVEKQSPETYRLLTNLIYRANNYFDVGLPLQERMFCNNGPAAFVALETVYQGTRDAMLTAGEELKKFEPRARLVVENFIGDGQRLFASREEFSGVTYREIDSGIFATLVLGVIGGGEYLRGLGIDPEKACATEDELVNKYHLFQIGRMELDAVPASPEVRRVIGMQAIEMVLACLDDWLGQREDKLLGLPNSRENGDRGLIELISRYKAVARASGFSPLLVDTAAAFFSVFYEIKVKLKTRRKNGEPIGLSEIQRHRNVGSIHLLREWLNYHGLLNEMVR